VFLTNEPNKIIDAAFGAETVLQQQTRVEKSPPKALYRRIEGALVRSPAWVIIKTPDGKIRPMKYGRTSREAGKFATRWIGHSHGGRRK
jgi:hypothetical protein